MNWMTNQTYQTLNELGMMDKACSKKHGNRTILSVPLLPKNCRFTGVTAYRESA
jgi:hypothetical protein